MSSDDRLVELVVDGDDTAFELLYARHVMDALAFADGLLGSREEAEEAIRHSFAAARAYLADGGRRTAFEPWLYAILENHCLAVLQRRRGGPEAAAEDAPVVDLDDWRRRRKLLGGGLPLAPSAGLHDSVMSACGIGGAGTATTAAAPPLLAGTLAKVAVVALLAGGGGVAADVVSDRGGAAGAAGDQTPQVRMADADGAAPPGAAERWSRPADRPEQGSERTGNPTAPDPAGKPGSRRSDDRGQAASPTGPALQPYPQGEASGTSADGSAPVGAPQAPGERLADAIPPPSPDRAVSRLGERLKARLPNLGDLPKVKPPTAAEPPTVDLPSVVRPPAGLPGAVRVPKLGDDGGVVPVKSPTDLRALLVDEVESPPS